jgi:hypothetical protein
MCLNRRLSFDKNGAYANECNKPDKGCERMAFWQRGSPLPFTWSSESCPKRCKAFPPVVLLLAATILEVSGDAGVRIAMYNHVGLVRFGLFLGGAALLLGYGTFLNLAPLQFGQVVGLYLATLFVVWQLTNFVAFRTLPTLPIVLGGLLVIAGGAIITFWRPG